VARVSPRVAAPQRHTAMRINAYLDTALLLSPAYRLITPSVQDTVRGVVGLLGPDDETHTR
jgi:hypothetical protein